MEQTVAKVIEKHFGKAVEAIKPLGGGFYGRAFLAKMQGVESPVVVKLYLFDNLAENEALQLTTLASHSTLKMPEVYGVYKATENGLLHDALVMEYLEGVNAGTYDVSTLSAEARERICEDIVDNIIAVHSTVHPAGFGELTAKEFATTWQEFYYPRAKAVVEKARKLHSIGQLPDGVMDVFDRSIEKFSDIFYLPITQARLIHGDYNTWNIMLSPDKSRAAYVIDPFGCCYADSEYDLYQLDNANGKAFGLLKRYAEKMPLSENYLPKRCFYELYSEVSHYHDAGVAVNAAWIEGIASNLAAFL